MPRLLSAIIALLFAAGAWMPEASAEADESARPQAQRAFQSGMELVAQERWEDALERFDESLRLYPTQSALFNRALCLGLSGRPAEAVRDLEEHRERYGASVSAERRREVEEELERFSQRIGRIEVRVDGVDSAAVLIDGNPAGEVPLSEPLVVNPGRHQLTVQAEGVDPVSRWVEVGAGDRTAVVIAIDPSAVASDDVDDSSGGEPAPLPPAPDNRGGLRIGAYALTGVAVAALGTALGLYLWNDGRYEDWEREDSRLEQDVSQATLEELQDDIDAHNDLGGSIATVDIVSWALLGVGVAGAAAAAALWALGFKPLPDAQVSLLPTRQGFLLTGRF